MTSRILILILLLLITISGCVTVECYSDEEVSDESCVSGNCTVKLLV